jgi:hypothetical protein
MGEAGTNYRSQTILHVFLFFIVCRFYKLTVSEQAQVTLQVRVSVSGLVSSFLALPSVDGDQKKCFHWDQNPLSAALLSGKV